MVTKFGPAGNSSNFYSQGNNKTLEVAQYLKNFSLDAYEYQCGRGVRITKKNACELGEVMKKNDITLSVHAPYYISMSSIEPEIRSKSVDYILQSAVAARNMQADRIIVHTGSCATMSRETALTIAGDTLVKALKTLKEHHLEHIHICLETMGKINQLGTLDEVLYLCGLNETVIPCIDFGHINAREQGILKTEEDFLKIFNIIEDKLGIERLKNIHIHFSKVMYTIGGEKKHLTFEDITFGPSYEYLINVIINKNCTPIIICESAGTQAEDACAMKIYYEKNN